MSENQEVVEETIEGTVDDVEKEDIEEQVESENLETEDEPAENESDGNEEEQEEDLVITIGDDEPEEEEVRAPQWVKDLRKKNKEDQRRIRELEEKLAAKEQPETPRLGKKPTLEDHDFDTDSYESALAEWYDQKREVEKQERAIQEQQEAQQKAWQRRLDAYSESKSELSKKVADFEDAELSVSEVLDVTQQGIIVHGASDATKLIYALGKNPRRLKELSEIKDPVQFAFAAARLEADIKMKPKKAPPAPEKKVTGAAPKGSSMDAQLERLREKAAKTGDFSEVHAYKRKMKASQ